MCLSLVWSLSSAHTSNSDLIFNAFLGQFHFFLAVIFIITL